MQLSKRHPQQPRLLFPDVKQAALWNHLSPEQQQACRKLLSQLLHQIVSQPDLASAAAERSNHD
jgi:hypothetical protein